jgi:hypothetical protein
MGIINKNISSVLFSSILVTASCTLLEVQAPVDVDIQVGPNVCDFVEAFIAEPDPSWRSIDYNGCRGYAQDPSGACLSSCDNTDDCGRDYYCIHEVHECYPRMAYGACTSSVECASNICMCMVCVDEDALVDFIGSAAIESISP